MPNDEQWGIWTVFGEAEIADQFASHVNLAYPRLQITLDGSNAHKIRGACKMVAGEGVLKLSWGTGYIYILQATQASSL